MIGAKAGAAGAKRSRRKSTKREPDTERVRGGVAGVSVPGDGGSGVGGELDEVENVKVFGVRDSPKVIKVSEFYRGLTFYEPGEEGKLVAAITSDVARVHTDPNCPEKDLNILKVELCMKKEAQIVHEPVGKRFVVEFTKRHPLKLDDLPDELFPLKLEGLTYPQLALLKLQIVKQGRQCFRELKKEITGDSERRVRGRQRKDLDQIQPDLEEDDVPQEGDRIQALKDEVRVAVVEFTPSNGKLLDAKGEADKSDLITFLKVLLQKLKPAQNQRKAPMI